jgi:tRNA(fMet)-specific endonuclease VapC
MYLLDTNTCIFIKNKKPIHVLDRLREALNQRICLSSITIAELQFGVYNSQNIEKNRNSLTEFLAPFEILDFDDQDAEMFGIIRSQLKKEGKLIGPYDMLIAAQALAKDLTIVTNNTDEFSRIKSLKLEDWKE